MQAVGLLRERGYAHVRHFSPGIQGWIASGGVVERGAVPEPSSAAVVVPARTAAWSPARRGLRARTERALDALRELSFTGLVLTWLGLIAGTAVAIWLDAWLGGAALVALGQPLAPTADGLVTALYFSFVTATSVGFGDVVPIGFVRGLAVVEAAAALLIFGVLVSKFVGKRQDELLEEIHRVSFDERVGRVRMSLHFVLADLHALGVAATGAEPDARRLARLESLVGVFGGELRTIHELLFRNRGRVDDAVLEGLLTRMSACLVEVGELAARLRAVERLSPALADGLHALAESAEEICGECVPHDVAPFVRASMNRVQQLGRALVSA